MAKVSKRPLKEKQVGEMLTKTFDPSEVTFREGDESQVSFLQDG